MDLGDGVPRLAGYHAGQASRQDTNAVMRYQFSSTSGFMFEAKTGGYYASAVSATLFATAFYG
jgi:hypothetical protein